MVLDLKKKNKNENGQRSTLLGACSTKQKFWGRSCLSGTYSLPKRNWGGGFAYGEHGIIKGHSWEGSKLVTLKNVINPNVCHSNSNKLGRV